MIAEPVLRMNDQTYETEVDAGLELYLSTVVDGS